VIVPIAWILATGYLAWCVILIGKNLKAKREVYRFRIILLAMASMMSAVVAFLNEGPDAKKLTIIFGSIGLLSIMSLAVVRRYFDPVES
jgi:uncharacterized membrane protein YjjP (DUF1212 family)